MPKDTSEAQESRSVPVGYKVTPSEKRAISFVAGALNKTESDVLREMPLQQILQKYAELRQRLGIEEPQPSPSH